MRRLRRRKPSFPTLSEISTASNDLASAYELYVTKVSTPEMAMSLQTAALLLALCRSESIASALDLGSGFSSYVLRRWAVEANCSVLSLDDDPAWLTRTEEFLEKQSLPVAGLDLWPNIGSDQFELVVHDLAKGAEREGAMPVALRASARLTLFDDAQHRGHRRTMVDTCAQEGVELYSLRALTLDDICRYAMLAIR